ncbi:MAG: D-sedoheptulose 7-phosphate isomerase [Alphaproteobacteria bacterium]
MTGFDLDRFFEGEFAEHGDVLAATRDAVREDFATLLRLSVDSVRAGGKLIFFGNGGSAADAQHLATELCVRYRKDRAPIAALALTTDSSALTAIGNDLGFEQLFARQLRALGREGDIVIAISTSGRSPNIIEALKAAREMKLVAAGLTGGDGGAMKGLAEPLLVVPGANTARIQEMHIMLGQMLCGGLEISLGLT